jgi:hypothetical protein
MAYRTGSATSYSSTNQSTSTASVNSPVGVQQNDIIIILGFACAVLTSAYNISDSGDGFSAGNAVFGAGPAQGPNANLSWIYKVAGASEPASYTVNVGANNNNRVLICAAWTGRNTSSPIGINATTGPTAGTGSPVSFALTGGTASAGDDLIWVPLNNPVSGGAAWTNPSGFSSGLHVTSTTSPFPEGYFAYENNVSAGATGTLTGTETGVASDIFGVVISLAAAAAAAPLLMGQTLL